MALPNAGLYDFISKSNLICSSEFLLDSLFEFLLVSVYEFLLDAVFKLLELLVSSSSPLK